jgi:hypothetical protein
MERFGAATRDNPALTLHRTLRDRRSGRLVGLAVWESGDAWAAAVPGHREVLKDDDFDELLESPPDVFMLDEGRPE